jgi:PAS domain-containing protein
VRRDTLRAGLRERRETEPDFRSIFEHSPVPLLVLDPALRIVAVTQAYLDATMTQRDLLLDRHLFDAFPTTRTTPTQTARTTSAPRSSA